MSVRGDTLIAVSPSAARASPHPAWVLFLLAAVVLVTAAVRLRLLEVPLDRDEGEYAYFGQLLLEGVPPYAAAYNLKAPGIYGVYALILAAFGQTTTGIRLGLIVVTSATTVLTYLLARRLVGLAAGLVAAAVYAVQALNPKVLGLAAYAEHFVLLFVVAGALVLQTQARDRRPAIVLAAGLLFGVAFLMKQSAAAFVVGGALTMLLSSDPDGTPRWPRRLRMTALFVAGAVIPFALACLALLGVGTLGTFWFWSFVYGSTYSAGLLEGWSNLVARLAAVAPSASVTLALGAIGLGALFRGRLRSRGGDVLLLVAASCLGTMVGLHFRPQYCLLMLPALALLAAIGLDALGRLLAGPRASVLLVESHGKKARFRSLLSGSRSTPRGTCSSSWGPSRSHGRFTGATRSPSRWRSRATSASTPRRATALPCSGPSLRSTFTRAGARRPGISTPTRSWSSSRTPRRCSIR